MVTISYQIQVDIYPKEILISLEPRGVPPHRLSLKAGTLIKRLHNMDAQHLCTIGYYEPYAICYQGYTTFRKECGNGVNVSIPIILSILLICHLGKINPINLTCKVCHDHQQIPKSVLYSSWKT